MTYKCFLRQVVSGNLFELPFNSLSTVTELNNGGNATFSFDYTTIKEQVCDPYGINIAQLFTGVFTEIWFEDANANKIWFGVVTDYQRAKDARLTYTLLIGAVDYFSILQKRRTSYDKIYTAVDSATIPWDLINISQTQTSGDLGITRGVTASTGLIVSPEYTRAEIKQSISDLSNYKVSGSFDFDIDNLKNFNIYYPRKGSLRPNVVFDDLNIAADGVIIPVLLNITNKVYSRGQGTNSTIPETSSTADAGTVAEYTLLEDIITDTTTIDPVLLQAEGDKFLALNKLPLSQITIKHDDSVDLTTYDVGDTVIVNIIEEGINYQQYRVKKRSISIDLTQTLICSLDLLII